MILLYIILCLSTYTAGQYEEEYTNWDETTATFFEDSEQYIGLTPKLFKKNTKVTAVLGYTALLFCKVIEGDEPVIIRWEFKSNKAGESSTLDYEGPKLVIKSVRESDAGKYTCTAENDAGTDQHSIQLDIKDEKGVAPKIFKQQNVIETQFGKLLIFSCRLTEGSQGTTIWWSYKKKKTDMFKKVRPLVAKDPVLISKFVIKSVKPEDLGFYKCIAENRKGRDEHTFNVIIKAPPSKPPEIDKSVKTVYAKKGLQTSLNCKVIGPNPATRIQWLYRKQNPKIFITLKQEGPSLTISKVSADNAGFYKCVAQNEAGSNAHVIQLIVRGILKGNGNEGVMLSDKLNAIKGKKNKLNDEVVPPKIRFYTDIVRRSVGYPVALFCNLKSGHDETSISWQFKKYDSSSFYDLLSTKTPLVIEYLHTDDTGTYRCIAENEAGYDTMDIKLSVVEPMKDVMRQIEDVDGYADLSTANETIGREILKDENNKPAMKKLRKLDDLRDSTRNCSLAKNPK